MRSIIAVFGTFLFGLFCEFFIRVVIIFYHQSEFNFSGLSGLPGVSWVLILGIGVFIATWISGMLTVTITHFAPFKHLLALFSLFLLWRVSEYFGMAKSQFTYTIVIILIQGIALYLAYIIKRKTNASISPSEHTVS